MYVNNQTKKQNFKKIRIPEVMSCQYSDLYLLLRGLSGAHPASRVRNNPWEMYLAVLKSGGMIFTAWIMWSLWVLQICFIPD